MFAAGYTGTTKNLQFVLNTQKSPYLNQATQKLLAKFPGIENFKPPQNPSIIPVTWNPEYPYPGIMWGKRVAGFHSEFEISYFKKKNLKEIIE